MAIFVIHIKRIFLYFQIFSTKLLFCSKKQQYTLKTTQCENWHNQSLRCFGDKYLLLKKEVQGMETGISRWLVGKKKAKQ